MNEIVTFYPQDGKSPAITVRQDGPVFYTEVIERDGSVLRLDPCQHFREALAGCVYAMDSQPYTTEP